MAEKKEHSKVESKAVLMDWKLVAKLAVRWDFSKVGRLADLMADLWADLSVNLTAVTLADSLELQMAGQSAQMTVPMLAAPSAA